MLSHRRCPKCSSTWVTQHYCNGHHCNHRGGRPGCGGEHLRLTCSGCGYGWNEATHDHREPAAPEAPSPSPRRRNHVPRILFEGDEGAPKLPTMHPRPGRWRSICRSSSCSV
jgi:hypothetical protein